MSQIWTNDDGLTLKFGVEKTDPMKVGIHHQVGPLNMAEITVDYTELPTDAAGSTIIDRNFVLPTGSIIEKVEIITSTAYDSAADAMTMNVGWIDLDETSNTDVDAFVVAATQTELNDGGTSVAGWVGAEVLGSPTTTAKYLTWEVAAADATAGEGVIRIYYSRH